MVLGRKTVMSDLAQNFKCDGCGKNHIEDESRWVTFDNEVAIAITIAHGIFLDNELGNPTLHACGQECAMKLFARWLTRGKL